MITLECSPAKTEKVLLSVTADTFIYKDTNQLV